MKLPVFTRPLPRLTLPIVSGVLYGLAFPPYHVHFLAWVALVPLFASLVPSEGERARSFLEGFTALFAAYLLIFIWLWPTFHAAHIGLATTVLCWVGLSAVLAIYGGLFAVFYTSLPWPSARPWLGAAAWVMLDEIRTVILTGFPWALASHTMARWTPLIQVAALTGAPGVTFLLILVNGSLAELRAAPSIIAVRRSAVLSLLVVLSCLVGGELRLMHAEHQNTGRSLRAALLQGNIDQYRKWDDAYEADIRATYLRLIQEAVTFQQPELCVWPETAVPGWVPGDPFYTHWVSDLAARSRTPQLFGCLSGNDNASYNAAIFATADGKLVAQYNKRHLVPFGEYVPFGGFLRGVVPYLGEVGTFQSGKEAVHFRLGDIRLSPNICYEAMFPSLVRDEARGADVIVNITNDGWFLKSGAPEQHFVTNIYRAVENGRPVLRAANTGISAFIDAYGRVRMESPLLTTGSYTFTMPLPPHNYQTLFGRWGNWFGYLCTFASVAGAGLALRSGGFHYHR